MTGTRSARDRSEEGRRPQGGDEEGTGQEGGGEEDHPAADAAAPADEVTRLRRGAAALLLLAAQAAGAATLAPGEALFADIDQRLAAEGADRVNAGLDAATMAALHRRAADCELAAVSLAVRLGRGNDTRAANAHRDALRSATGRCAPFVLALAAPDEIPRLCASLDAWGPAQTARELRRRMAAIAAHPVLRGTARGKACRAAYLYELENTRVVLKGKAR